MKNFESCSKQTQFPMCHGKSICNYCSEYEEKEKEMEKQKFQFESEEQADIIITEFEIMIEPDKRVEFRKWAKDKLKEKGYILKSELEQLIDEAVTHYKRYVSCVRGMCDKEDGQYILIEDLYKAFQALIKENERLKNK